MHRSSLYLLCVLLCLLGTTDVGSKASSLKQVSFSRLPREKNEPIRIRAVKVKGRKLRSNENFFSNGDWLDDLTITIENRTNKRILFASIDLIFSAPQDPLVGRQSTTSNLEIVL